MPVRLPAGLRLVYPDSAGAFPAIAVDTPACSALVALQGAQLLRMENAAGAGLSWLSPGAKFVPGRAVRGGIPLCFPWFGNHPSDNTLPAHGFARNVPWQLVAAARQHDGTVTLSFELRDDEATRALWPHAFLARIDYTLGATLALRLSVTNTGAAAFAFGFALHNYFPVTDIECARVEGLAGVGFIDKLVPSSAALQREDGPLRIHGETDRVYHEAPGDYRVVDEAAGTTLAIRAPTCRSAVVWNPWREKAARLGDVPGDAWRRMLCVECGEAGAQDVRLRAGESRIFLQEIGRLP